MSKIGLGSWLSIAVLVGLGSGQAQALPGQPVTEVATWIQSHPTLQPAPGEVLLVRRTDSPSRRFTFEASITAPGRATAGDRKDIIRSESMSLFDTVNGVSQARMEESLAVVYGEDVYQDYRQASVVLRYPTAEMLSQAENLDRPLLRYAEGELRQGQQYAYWVETVQTPDGKPQNGQITVLLLEDLPKLQSEIESR